MTAPKKVLAPCSVCSRRTYVRRDGAIGYHAGTEKNQAGFRTQCAGVGQPPAVATRTDDAAMSGQDGAT